jgi:rRNA pseudouridine-1189 N-methylase Emg1 (Nep1/Mra1 family)
MKVKGYMYPQMKKPVGMLSTNKSDRHDITEILLKVVLYSITITLNTYEVYIKAVFK